MLGQQKNFDLSGAKNVTCDECSNGLFETAFIVKKLTAELSPTGQEGIIPVPVFLCKKCGHINEEFAPTDDKLKQASITVPKQ
jgi:uncharacterized Zn finger protein